MNTFLYKIKKVPVCLTGLFCFLLCLFSIQTHAQKKDKGAQIEILNANTFEYEDRNGESVKRLIGDVRLKHEEALMFCDSAYVYADNTMDANGNVRINQGDSLRMYGDSLKYNGATRIANLRGNIRLINNDVTLTTKFLDYDRTENVAYYYNGGTMVNQKENNTLTSGQGYYYSNGESFYFKDSVVLVNPEYKIEADTLNYQSASEIVNFLGPTTITSDDNFIYTERGWYNTQTNKSKFYENAYLYSEEKIIEGDTLYYDRNLGFGEIICNGTITDTIEDIILKGDVAHLFELKDSAMITQEALLMQLFEDDTLYLHADTFKISSVVVWRDSVVQDGDVSIIIDTTWSDTVRTLFAYNHAKFYKKDMQGKADSVVYNFSDSTINFYHEPVIWSKENQITAAFIYIVMANGEIDQMYMNDKAFILSKVDSISEKFNQIKGKNMVGKFKDDELKRINVYQNSETIYYPLDDDGKYIGMNKLSGGDMRVFLKENDIETITFIKSPEGELSPLKEVNPKSAKLKGFNWRGSERPLDLFDVFIK